MSLASLVDALATRVGVEIKTVRTEITSKGVRNLVQASNSIPTLNFNLYDNFSFTAMAADISSMTTGLAGTIQNFQRVLYRFKDNGTPRAINWGGSYISGPGTLLTVTQPGKVHTVGTIWDNAAGKFVCMFSDAVGY